MNINVIRAASVQDATQIAKLVNDAYRPRPGAAGWTHESELVSGLRTTVSMIEAAMRLQDAVILVGLCDEEILACVQIEKHDDSSHIGLLAVSPKLQGAGIGKQMLQHAEVLAIEKFRSTKLILGVVSNRNELAAFYVRRGYEKTDAISDYPATAGVGMPLRAGLKVEMYEKSVETVITVER